MGNRCDNLPRPEPINQCAVNGDEYTENIEHFCTFAGEAGQGYRDSFCNAMSSAQEWGLSKDVISTCSFSKNDFTQEVPFGCGQPNGSQLQCRRIQFTGNPLTCCFNDLECTDDDPSSNPAKCYSDGDKRQHACANGKNGQPNYRSLVSKDCQDQLLQYCTGTLPTDDPNSLNWLTRWTEGGTASCTYAIQRNMFEVGGSGHCFTPPEIIPGVCNLPPPLPLSSEGYFWAQSLVSAAMARYTEQGFEIGTLPGFPGYNPWQDFLYANVCCPYSGLCQDGLDLVCADKTAQRISFNPAIAQWCGCHLPAGEYESYSTQFNIPPQCTPMCNRSGTIPISGINADPIRCTQNICLIDNVTVNLVNSQIGNGIQFDQMCDNCPGGQCSCIISNATVDVENSTIAGNLVPIGEGCGTLTCTQVNPGSTGPSSITVPCGATAGFNPYTAFETEQEAAQESATKSSVFWTVIIVSVCLLIIFFIISLLHPTLVIQ